MGTLQIIKSAQDELTSENSELKDTQVELIRKNTRMVNELEKLERECDTLKQRVEQQGEMIKGLQAELDQAQNETFKLRSERHETRERKISYERQETEVRRPA